MGRMKRSTTIALAVAAILVAALGAWLALRPQAPATDDGTLVELGDPVRDVAITEAKAPGRPIVLIDAGHGGHDPGAPGLSGRFHEKDLTLAFARELRDVLAESGRVRVALTRDSDRYLTLEQRADLARRIGASLFVSVHMDSAANPAARGATVYSLSDVASDAEAARFAAAENRAGNAGNNEGRADVEFLLADLDLRDQMADSAALATRLIGSSKGRISFRPEPHKFAAFHVLRRSRVPGVLFEAGYISNVEDEAALMTPEGRKAMVAALARAIEVDTAVRTTR